ncbi:regulatory protein RecX [Desulfosporosinus fructosivorans]|uniref:Regulatory protein RecX n=1 Tax=Desulfosporosinus fructosivorans TaxID=2018669 RepID=A0A4Z0QXI0_9FIRM|nr:RecX family transcriptional regulator [Desulfosporosinus fructosivorans]TGE35214.1 regulatory protein RecX [Desulfosporosinus fructosivorans]
MIPLTNSKPLKSAREVALDCLSRRALTHYELETRLKGKGYESSEVNEVLEKMEKLGYLNDQELALTVAQNRLKRYSQRRVLQDLQNRGLAPQVVEHALESSYSSDAEFQQCVTLARRWCAQEGTRWDQRIRYQETTKKALPRELSLQQKVARKLIQRGYTSDMVRNVLQTIINESDEIVNPGV